MKTYMPLDGLRWSRDSGSAHCDMSQKCRSRTAWGAILMVLLYHMSCWPFPNLWLTCFKYGYIGVDIFMLISGYGLCYSYEKNSLRIFYKHRALRLLPLYWYETFLFIPLSYIFDFRILGIKEIIANLTTLSYYGVWGELHNWFIASIMLLYLLFPLLYNLTKRYSFYTIFLSNLTVLILLYNVNIDWRFDCLLSRIPIFIFGIICYLCKKEKFNLTPFLVQTLIMLWLAMSYNDSIFHIAALTTPILLFFLSSILSGLSKLPDRITCYLRYAGKNSFALFTSNGVVGWLIMCFYYYYPENVHVYTIVPIYIFLQFLFGGMFIWVSDIFDKLQNRTQQFV